MHCISKANIQQAKGIIMNEEENFLQIIENIQSTSCKLEEIGRSILQILNQMESIEKTETGVENG